MSQKSWFQVTRAAGYVAIVTLFLAQMPVYYTMYASIGTFAHFIASNDAEYLRLALSLVLSTFFCGFMAVVAIGRFRAREYADANVLLVGTLIFALCAVPFWYYAITGLTTCGMDFPALAAYFKHLAVLADSAPPKNGPVSAMFVAYLGSRIIFGTCSMVLAIVAYPCLPVLVWVLVTRTIHKYVRDLHAAEEKNCPT